MEPVVAEIKKLEGQSTATSQVYWQAGGDSTFEDPYRQTERAMTSSNTIGHYDWNSHITNEGASGTVTVTLDDNTPVGLGEITFEVKAAQILRIEPQTNSGIYPGSNGDGKYIQSNNIGDRLTIRREKNAGAAGDRWFIGKPVEPLGRGIMRPIFCIGAGSCTGSKERG